MLQRIDRVLLRVPHLQAAVRFYTGAMGMKLVRQDARLAVLAFPDKQDCELVLHADADLPAEALYYLVDDVRRMYEQREELGIQFAQAPAPAARGWRGAIRDPFGNVLLIIDRTAARDQAAAAIAEDAKPPGALFPGVQEKPKNRPQLLIAAYEQVGRTADDLPYTPDFERLYDLYTARLGDKPPRGEIWRQLLNLRKGAKLPKLGEARSRPPAVTPEERQRLVELLGEEIGRRDRLPYTDRFDQLVDQFNRGRARSLSPHLVWRMVATLAK